ncbi:MAG: hypothetical protein MJE77_38325 [Proteobacteria bacterium]|nr:hypothetical protein [Pseudomonadota bacterium]
MNEYIFLFKLYQLTTGRRLFAMRQLRKLALARGMSALVQRIDEAMAHDRSTRRLDLEWQKARNEGTADPVLVELDRLLDSALVGLRDMTRALTRGARDNDPIHDQVEHLLSTIFPAGVSEVTGLPYVDELSAVETIIEMLRGELAELVEALGIGSQVARIESLTAEYRATQNQSKSRITYDKVKMARVKGHAFLCEVVAMVVGRFHRHDSDEHARARAELLAPILEQNEAIRTYRTRRRPVVDIDPDTGEPDSVDEPADSVD